MNIRLASLDDVADWAELRAALWPSATAEDHRSKLVAAVLVGSPDGVAFLALDQHGRLCGFAEATLRRDHVNGCVTSPVAFLEGVYVVPEVRGAGVGRALCSAVETWGRARGCVELASDAPLQNDASRLFHDAIGFDETERVVYFRKQL